MNKLISVVCIVFLSLLTSCGGGGGSGTGTGNSCSVLNLRVSNGDNCDANGSPVVPILISYTNGSVASCTGTFISLTSVLTAAHCVLGPVSDLAVLTPSGYASIADRTISQIWYDNRYNGSFSPAVPYDLAVIRISFPVNTTPVSILGADTVAVSERFTVYGYGLDENNQDLFDRLRDGDPDKLLKAGEMSVGGTDKNRLDFAASFNETGQSACPGDSGGPAIIERNGVPLVAGVVSFGTAQNCQFNSAVAFGNLGNSNVRAFVTSVVPDVSIR